MDSHAQLVEDASVFTCVHVHASVRAYVGARVHACACVRMSAHVRAHVRLRVCGSGSASIQASVMACLEGGGVAGHVGEQGRQEVQGRAGPVAGSSHEGEEAVEQAVRLGHRRQVVGGFRSHPQQADGCRLQVGLMQH